ncbi:hypothetical protein AB4Y90_07360 [Chryseobacterium sp. 2TAF14]|uniref:hypothetical protein n=1 Tax=Chryseobacterium sp. 2TAF14 TaxID=3233007 RepID=UPI003F913181
MSQSPEYNIFVNNIARFATEIVFHSRASWYNIDLNLTEPEIIKKFLLDKGVGVDYLNQNLSPILSNSSYEVKFASVFVHQKPRITRHTKAINLCSGSTPKCEIGDLLVVFCLLDKNKIPLFRSAVISQAKKESIIDSQSQKCLYDSDINFLMPKRVYEKSINPTPERFFPDYAQGRSKALHYLILDQHPTLKQVPWDSNLQYSWDHFINRILLGDLGLPFENATISDAGWNCIIHDLLNVGQGIIPSSISRGSEFFNIINSFNHFNEYEHYSIEIDDGAVGLPTLYIIVRDKEFEKKNSE